MLLTGFAMRAKLMHIDRRLRASLGKLSLAGLMLAATLVIAPGPIVRQCESFGALQFGVALAALAILGGAVYGGAIAALFGRQWFRNRQD